MPQGSRLKVNFKAILLARLRDERPNRTVALPSVLRMGSAIAGLFIIGLVLLVGGGGWFPGAGGIPAPLVIFMMIAAGTLCLIGAFVMTVRARTKSSTSSRFSAPIPLA